MIEKVYVKCDNVEVNEYMHELAKAAGVYYLWEVARHFEDGIYIEYAMLESTKEEIGDYIRKRNEELNKTA